MSGHRFEIRHDRAGFRAALVSSNGKTSWATPPYLRRRDAVTAIERICASTITTSPHADHPEIDWVGQTFPTEVRDVDERPPPPTPPTIGPPYWTTPAGFWHDRDYHWRHCYGDHCTESTPPAGTSIRGRLGHVTYQEKP